MQDSTPQPGCVARARSGQYECPACGIVWDFDDERPDCQEVDHGRADQDAD